MLAAKTTLPVIGVPIPTQHLGGLDSLLSIVQMPRGIPVATVAIGNADNAALLAAQILALSATRRSRPASRPAGEAQTDAVLGRPVERGAARLTSCRTGARPAAGRDQTVRPASGTARRLRPGARPPARRRSARWAARSDDGLEHDQHDQRPDRRAEERDERTRPSTIVRWRIDDPAVRARPSPRYGRRGQRSPPSTSCTTNDAPWLEQRGPAAPRDDATRLGPRRSRRPSPAQIIGSANHTKIAVDQPEHPVVDDEERHSDDAAR